MPVAANPESRHEAMQGLSAGSGVAANERSKPAEIGFHLIDSPGGWVDFEPDGSSVPTLVNLQNVSSSFRQGVKGDLALP